MIGGGRGLLKQDAFKPKRALLTLFAFAIPADSGKSQNALVCAAFQPEATVSSFCRDLRCDQVCRRFPIFAAAHIVAAKHAVNRGHGESEGLEGFDETCALLQSGSAATGHAGHLRLMRERVYPQWVEHRSIGWGAAISLALHILGAVVLAALPAVRPMPPLSQNGIAVEILTPEQFEAMTKPPDSPKSTGPESTARPNPPVTRETAVLPVPKAAPDTRPLAMIQATRILSGKTLATPQSRQAREALLQMADAERMEQLCDVEAMDQIHEWSGDFQPDRLIAYAMADTDVSGSTIRADGAAFRSKKLWYTIKFKCTLSADLGKVTAFEFLVGGPVSRAEWNAYNLPALH